MPIGVEKWVKEQADHMKPDRIYWVEGTREEMERLTWIPLNLDTDSVTFFPTGTALAATWNTDLAFRFGKGLAK